VSDLIINMVSSKAFANTDNACCYQPVNFLYVINKYA